MLERVYQRLTRFDVLRTAQWFYKPEPSRFTRLTQEGPACAVPATHSSDYLSRKKPFSRQTVLYCTACGLGFVPGMAEVLGYFLQACGTSEPHAVEPDEMSHK